MSTDYAEKEREFIAGLLEDTGRNLASWMDAISASGRSERNEIIDWLRHQGFQFSWASWLERIHHNGGRLIYAEVDGSLPNREQERRDSSLDEPPRRERLQSAVSSPPRPPAPPSSAGSIASGSADDVARLLSSAKGLRPLAELILNEIQRTIPGVVVSATGPLIVMAAPTPFAALLPAPKKLRLFGRFGSAGAGRAVAAEMVMKMPPPFPEMLTLDDARSIDSHFPLLIRTAAGR